MIFKAFKVSSDFREIQGQMLGDELVKDGYLPDVFVRWKNDTYTLTGMCRYYSGGTWQSYSRLVLAIPVNSLKSMTKGDLG